MSTTGTASTSSAIDRSAGKSTMGAYALPHRGHRGLDSSERAAAERHGTSSWTRGLKSYSLTVMTNPALHYNASCSVAPRFDAGKITAVVTRNSQTMTVTIEFTACGTYTVAPS